MEQAQPDIGPVMEAAGVTSQRAVAFWRTLATGDAIPLGSLSATVSDEAAFWPAIPSRGNTERAMAQENAEMVQRLAEAINLGAGRPVTC